MKYSLRFSVIQRIAPFIRNVYYDIFDIFSQKVEALRVFLHPRLLEVIEAITNKNRIEVGVLYGEPISITTEVV